MEIDIVVADIITNELQIDPSRVVVYGQNYKAPDDQDLYVVIRTTNDTILSSTNRFEKSTEKEIKKVNSFVDLIIEITSKNRDAYDRKHEIVMALTSTYSVKKQEELQFKLFRTKNIIDLTFIEGSSSLYRYNIPVRASVLHIKETTVDYFDKYRKPFVEIERK